MRYRLVFLTIILASLLAYVAINIIPKSCNVESQEAAKGPTPLSPAWPLPFKEGETLTYQATYKDFKIGESVLTFHGEENLDDRRVYHITFSSEIGALTDVEELYGDIETFLPVEVHRSIKKFGTFTTNIIEKYDQENFRVDIRKKTRFRLKEFSIEKDSPLHNAILLTYYCRRKDTFNKDEKEEISLPTVEFQIQFTGEETIETPLGEYPSYAFTSDPPKFKLWLSTDEKRIPLKIENPGKLSYSLEIKATQ